MDAGAGTVLMHVAAPQDQLSWVSKFVDVKPSDGYTVRHCSAEVVCCRIYLVNGQGPDLANSWLRQSALDA